MRFEVPVEFEVYLKFDFSVNNIVGGRGGLGKTQKGPRKPQVRAQGETIMKYAPWVPNVITGYIIEKVKSLGRKLYFY